MFESILMELSSVKLPKKNLRNFVNKFCKIQENLLRIVLSQKNPKILQWKNLTKKKKN